MNDDYVSNVAAKNALQQPEPPCEKYHCGYYEKCRHENLACESFHWYVNTGNTCHPKMVWKNKRGELDMSTVPTYDRYLKIYGNTE